jgi:hypothetical protein
MMGMIQKNPADFTIGFRGLRNGGGTGREKVPGTINNLT